MPQGQTTSPVVPVSAPSLSDSDVPGILLGMNQLLQRIAIATRCMMPLMPISVYGPPTTQAGLDTTYEFRTNRVAVPAICFSIVNSTAAIAYFAIDNPATTAQYSVQAASSGLNGYVVWNATMIHQLHIFTAATTAVGGLDDQPAGTSPCLWITAWANPEWANMKGRA